MTWLINERRFALNALRCVDIYPTVEREVELAKLQDALFGALDAAMRSPQAVALFRSGSVDDRERIKKPILAAMS